MKIYAVAFTPEAELEALKAYFWYEIQNPGLGENFKQCLDSKIESLKQNPEAFSYILKNSDLQKLNDFLII